MNTLKTIQILSKIGKILSKIVYICCIVGFIGCLVGVAAMLIGAEAVKIEGMTLKSFLEQEANVSIATIWSAIIAGMILCVGEIYLSRKAHRYFSHELEVGTPFTMSGAKELLHLGISAVWVPIATSVAAIIAVEIVEGFADSSAEINLNFGESISLGVMLIVTSLLCRHGAELTERPTSDTAEAR